MKKKEAQKIMEELRDDYNAVASSFASTRDRLWPEMKFLFRGAEEGERVLDIGCGNGRFSRYLEKTHYTGVDFSEKMIKEAKKRFPKKNFIIGNALSLPFISDTFSKVYSIAVIHQIPSPENRRRFVLEAKRVLSPGGKLFLTAWNIKKGRSFFCAKEAIKNFFSSNFLGKKDIYLKRKRYYYLFSQKELSSLVVSCKMKIEEEGEVKKGKRSNFYIIAKK